MITNNFKHQLGDQIISLLGILPLIIAKQQLTVGDNPLSEHLAKEYREKAKGKSDNMENLRESFISCCLVSEEILIKWVKDNEELINSTDTLTGSLLLKGLKQLLK